MDRQDFLKTASTAASAAATEQLLTPLLRAKQAAAANACFKSCSIRL